MNPTRVLASGVPVLVLAHLGLALAACHDAKAPSPLVNDPSITAIPSATSFAPAVASVEPTSAPIALVPTSTTASPVATTTGTPTFRPKGTPVPTGTAKTLPPQQQIMRGRPLVVDGVTHMAPYTRGGDCAASTESDSVTAADVDSLLGAAREEHASIAAFARTIAELMSLGAPTWLLFETQNALADEIRHTEMSLAMIERFTGERPLLGALPAATLPLRHGKEGVGDFFSDVFRGGVIGETLAAAEAEQRRDEATDSELAGFYNTIFEDESRHAALAFKTLRWLIDEHPSLAILRDEEAASLRKDGSFTARTLVLPLLEVLA